ncbi:DNA-binding transcriptional regulator, PucR family [Streptacidiphilus jiangxiensis]|uniref:DNA-binding transcriptional regulator, PucR family n=2 Tax=Streptacidiphilus jiangxiensis TaxID=235985 RepID=A0A1H7X9C1_STRJI|nr:DNA-binding transcriptional regulator, PucR family [Streptacidiphilus jiangxiensis]
MDSLRPRATLGRVLDDLGTTLLALVHGTPDAAEHIGGVAIYDPLDSPDLPPGAVVLGVSLQGDEATIEALRDMGAKGASALVLRAPVTTSPEVAEAAAKAGIVVFALTRGAAWAQLVVMLRSLLTVDTVSQAEPGTLGGVPTGDLFALANAITALLDAPVTIEDRSSRLLAFSGRQDEADGPRVEAILGRQVPEETTQVYLDRGVFRALYRSDHPIWIDPDRLGLDQMPRTAIAVRAGDEVLGFIWATMRARPTDEQVQALVEGAKVVALHLLRARAGEDAESRLRSDLVATALEGGPEAREALARLGLADQPVVLLALEVLDSPVQDRSLAKDTSMEAVRRRLSDAFAVHLTALDPRSASALVGNIAYGLMPTSRHGADAENHAISIASEFLDRVRRYRAVVGVGPLAHTPDELAHSRTTAGRALRVLRAQNGGGPRAASLSHVHLEALLLELMDLADARGDAVSGPISQLIAYDAEHKSNLLDSLSAWFDAFGDVTEAATLLAIHPNTLRYRLRRISEICEVDLADPHTRLAMMVQLRMAKDRHGEE